MVWWKGVLKTLFSIILILSLILFVVFFVASNANSEQALKPAFASMFESNFTGSMSQENITAAYNMFKASCTGESITLPIQGLDGKDLILTCAELNAAGSSGIVNLIENKVFDSAYQKDYGSNPITIIKAAMAGNSLVLVSKSAHDAFRTASFMLLAIAAVMIMLIFLLSIPKLGSFVCLGIDFIIAGIPFIAIKILGPEFISKLNMDAQTKSTVMPMAQKLLSQLSTLFLAFIVAGIALLIIGIVAVVVSRKKRIKKGRGKKSKAKEPEEENEEDEEE